MLAQDYPAHRPQQPYLSSQPAPIYPFLSNPNVPASPFKAPAHKHAHHLHSIPPREKSTRTLIIDHMLWVHGRTRFAQARAELGMTDRTGGPLASNYAHRRRPENYEEDEDQNSEGEDVVKLKARAGNTNQSSGDDEDRRLDVRDLSLARTLRVRAEGLEKVVTAMLGQPPPVHATDDDDILTPPTSPKTPNSSVATPDHHTLPNGVRLRLALGTLINDLFARQAPIPPYRHQFASASRTPSDQSPADTSNHTCAIDGMPTALSSLSTVCAACSGCKPPYPTGPQPSGYSSQSNFAYQQQQFTPSARTRALYKAGADPNTDNSPRGFRCPRHLQVGCEICVCAKTLTRPGGGASRGRSMSAPGSRPGASNPWKGMPGGVGPGGGGISGWQDGIGIGAGLLRPGVEGSVLRRKVHLDGDYDEGASSSSGAGNTKLSSLIPRFIRLSALVAVELALEAQDEEEARALRSKESGAWTQMPFQQSGRFTPPSSPTVPRMSPSITRVQEKPYDTALLPTREWYLLLAGLLTRAVLEGYLTAGWRGLDPVKCLLTVGLGMAEGDDHDEHPSGFEEFDPDGLPTLREATKVLFPSGKSLPPPGKSQAEEEYKIEMHERLRMFHDIPASTPDLSTHMEDLAWRFPAEPIERAAVRFCEAIAKWRGKPELESYKKRTPTTTYSENSELPIESLVHSNPSTPTYAGSAPRSNVRRGSVMQRGPSIDVYFTQPPAFRENAWGQMKRLRPSDDSGPGPSKRIHL